MFSETLEKLNDAVFEEAKKMAAKENGITKKEIEKLQEKENPTEEDVVVLNRALDLNKRIKAAYDTH